ncbi:hypothetical protein M2390_000332 [Mycetocola sp. BIGb0189]|uniref:hypothetical protein n=1 Tax=Mycetocola sp. BIGb0189 TaxID=2940604 RepID=UPI00216817B8|nr:hypothetical protein [Mycetocola sp. BIGb0189]MCS4275174.1 hypothetical protein [Mycetocola sp. BIGb0189]
MCTRDDSVPSRTETALKTLAKEQFEIELGPVKLTRALALYAAKRKFACVSVFSLFTGFLGIGIALMTIVIGEISFSAVERVGSPGGQMIQLNLMVQNALITMLTIMVIVLGLSIYALRVSFQAAKIEAILAV